MPSSQPPLPAGGSSGSASSQARSSVLAPPCPSTGTLAWTGLSGSSLALALVSAARAYDAPVVAVIEETRQAHILLDAARFFDPSLTVLGFPDWESLPYDTVSPHQDIVSERLRALAALPGLAQGLVITTVAAVMQRLAPLRHVESYSFSLGKGIRIPPEAFRERLVRSGYQAVTQVMAAGEFALRGGILDIFPMGQPLPLRIEWLDEEIDSLRSFDPETQRSLTPLTSIECLPAREYDLTELGIQRFRSGFRASFEGDPHRQSLYRDVSAGLSPAGIEYYLPLFFEATARFTDYLPTGSLLVTDGDLAASAGRHAGEVAARYEARRHDPERRLLAPELVFLSPDEILDTLSTHPRVTVDAAIAPNTAIFATQPVPNVVLDARNAHPAAHLSQLISTPGLRSLLVAESAGRREQLRDLLRQAGIAHEITDDWADFLSGSTTCGVITGTLDTGTWLSDRHIVIITEHELYGEIAIQRRRRRTPARDAASIIRDLAELSIGDPVVHEDHGIGRYLGLQHLDIGDGRAEFLALGYAGGDKLYLPATSLHLIHRYTATHPDSAPLHKLGNDTWEKAKSRARAKAHDVAVELLELYARRAARPGHATPPRDHAYHAFSATFPFEETPDQARVIEEVLADMEAPRPMDRLVCGDVGFGKTEVAMRAAFMAARHGSQVVILAPTTLLVQQHEENFRDRFADSGFVIESLSRFRSEPEQQAAIARLAQGKVDIIIGTHRLLQPDVHFQRLGLVIIDEEHRFGVRQKEQLKALRSDVDVLTLTATPVPRTLNFALAGLRDISLITTPPQERLAIKTVVTTGSDALLREACLREIRRGGQVYFLHNDVKSIRRAAESLQKLVPEGTVRIAHGQMPERELEHVMLDFYHQRFNLLVCSTIIETGIDVPNANTIIIERADKFGLAQLHQLRGRVGRSHRRAYAYLLVPEAAAITPDARKRLDAIGSLEELGVGFMLASHDLEIRGAGELLGEAQSGQIDEVGFTLYSELLERAVASLRSGGAGDLAPTRSSEVILHAPALLPEDYVPDPHTRLILYKRISACPNDTALGDLKVELIDRFGLLPEAAARLFDVTALRLRAAPLGIRRIEAGPKGLRMDFSDKSPIDPDRLIRLIQSRPGFRLDGASLRLSTTLADFESRRDAIRGIIDALAGSPPTARH